MVCYATKCFKEKVRTLCWSFPQMTSRPLWCWQLLFQMQQFCPLPDWFAHRWCVFRHPMLTLWPFNICKKNFKLNRSSNFSNFFEKYWNFREIKISKVSNNRKLKSKYLSVSPYLPLLVFILIRFKIINVVDFYFI